MEFMFTWFLSGIIFIVACIPLIMRAHKITERAGTTAIPPRYSVMVVVIWGFIGALFIRDYDHGFWYMASVFLLSTVTTLYKKQSQDEIPNGFTALGIWMIVGLLVPFITG